MRTSLPFLALLALLATSAEAGNGRRCRQRSSIVGSGSSLSSAVSGPASTATSAAATVPTVTTSVSGSSTVVGTSSSPSAISGTSSSSGLSNTEIVAGSGSPLVVDDGGSSTAASSASSAPPSGATSAATESGSSSSSSTTPPAGSSSSASTSAAGSSSTPGGTTSSTSSSPGSSSSASATSSASSSASSPASTSSSSDGSDKFVFAHHMVGNTYPYTEDDWASDIQLASANGIDGFALNIGTDSWQPQQVKNAYTAAEKSSSGFKMFISFDMTVMPCTSSSDGATLQKYITDYASSPAQYKYDGKVFASTFSGEKCTFGQGSVIQGWQSAFIGPLTGSNAVFFVPSFFVDPSTFSTYASVMNGQLNWNSAWPITVTDSSMSSLLAQSGATNSKIVSLSATTPLITTAGSVVLNLTSSLSSDNTYIDALDKIGNQLYMGTVSPWFYTHYSPQTFNKNFIYLSDQLYASRWQSIIQSRDKFPMIEVLTWNDYGESSYIGPIKGSQPNSEAWVDGFDHTAFLDLTKYFSTAYKTGSYPTVDEDKLYLFARPHAKDATATADSVAKPTNADVAEDALFGVILASEAGDVTVTAGKTVQTVQVQPGLTQVSVPLSAGDGMGMTLARNGKTVVQLNPGEFTFEATPKTYNFNAFAAYAGAGGSGSNSSSGNGSSTSTTTSAATSASS